MQKPEYEPTRAERLEQALRRAFSPTLLAVADESARHIGHAGARPEGETHYSVALVSEAFRGQSRVARHRAVHDVVAQEFGQGLHALALTLRTPEEHASVQGSATID
ncbi:MAG: BolA family transcriptional regulator [Acetobacteraceae bacterium]|nr:BolA family transcriptional regulator [Acetobacteraceae bacterium]MBV8577376.1 BolA family transcriptional regulator [Acetobacteraceae bacterium]